MFADLYRLLANSDTPSTQSLQALGFESSRKAAIDSHRNSLQITTADNGGKTHFDGFGEDNGLDPQHPPEQQKPDWSFPVYIIQQRTAETASDDHHLLGIETFKLVDDKPLAGAPELKPLLRPDALNRKLLQAFVQEAPSGRLDARRLSERAASHRSLLPLPRQQREQPVQQFWLIMEYLPELIRDVEVLQQQFSSLPLHQRPERQVRLTDDSATWLDEQDAPQATCQLPRIPEAYALLVVGDPAQLSPSLYKALRRVKRPDTCIVWLSPRPHASPRVIYWGESHIPVALNRLQEEWGRLVAHERTEPDASKSENRVVSLMKILLWPFHPITAALARDCRLLLGGSTADEQAFWQSIARGPSDLLNGQCAIRERKQRRRHYETLCDWVSNDPDTVKEIYRQLQPHIDGMTATFRHRANLNLPAELVDSEDLAKAETFFASLAVKARSSQDNNEGDHQHLCAVILQMAQGLVPGESPTLKAAIEAGQQGYRHYDPEAAMLKDRVVGALDQHEDTKAFLVVSQQGLSLHAEPRAGALVSFGYNKGGVALDTPERQRPVLLQLDEPLPLAFNDTAFTLYTSSEQIHISQTASQRFHFAESLWQDREGTHLMMQNRLRIDYPASGGGPIFNTTDAPDWLRSCTLGIDEYGLWAQLKIAEVPVLMRWIAPGRFQMGSPEDESERDDDERQHWVTLSEGYWLAETACTQRLWEAVMGENPSGFKGVEKPVENVRWENTQEFFVKVKAVYGVELSLPTEAQWEYACRAGTGTPFSQGLTIGTDQVNYDGNYPYGDVPKGEYRRETVAVKSFEPNGWGLYEMHGNVLEWCKDWYGDYAEGEQVDPVGPEAGDYRVLRGGSWFDHARLCRCAFRFRFVPSVRSNFIGFRFAQITGAPAGAERPGSKEVGKTGAGRSPDSRGFAGRLFDIFKDRRGKQN